MDGVYYNVSLSLYVYNIMCTYVLLRILICIYKHTFVTVTLHSPHFTDDDMLQESGIYTGQLMILEVKKDDGGWPRDTYTQGTMVCTVHVHTTYITHCTYVCTCALYITCCMYVHIRMCTPCTYTHDIHMCLLRYGSKKTKRYRIKVTC